MRINIAAVSLLLAIVVMPLSVHAADNISVQAILITASKEKAPADSRLASYEETLQRNLPESSFKFVAERTASVAPKGSANIVLASGHRVELEGGTRDTSGISLKVRWLNAKTVVMTNSFVFQPGVPIVLLHRPSGDANVPIVILIAR
jgi:hypothetical protein